MAVAGNDKPFDPAAIMGQLMTGATARQYIGTLADSDAKSLITRNYNTTKEEAAAVDRIVGAPHTLYISHGDFVRHAIWELLMAYEEAGFPDSFIPDVTAHLKNMRESAHRTRLRQEFSDILTVYETSLMDGCETGDWDLVEATLDTLEGYIERTPEPHWKHYLRRVVLRSSVMKTAIDSFYDVAQVPGNERYQVGAERWILWLEGLAE